LRKIISIETLSKELLLTTWREQKSLRKAAKTLGVGWRRLHARMKELHIDTSSRFRQKSTYESCFNSKGKRVSRHTLIAEQKYGRTLQKGEVVHHIDGNRQNNHAKNLCVLSRRKHNQIHKQLEQIALNLYRKGLLTFKEDDGYIISQQMEKDLDGK